ncbi:MULTISPECIES: thioredoxin family protein [Empedobacter]|uniref:Thioredoxin family protein n=1 Tax=Empedobacter stercoris TaxID=1628248 RepID=A0ABX1WL54_9FLAO|nr:MULTISPECIES: thioredoxin family protein [Empedobacter]MCA4775929.1 thioredoxin family protein [Empedobacter stercoris]MCA4810024.1 thioredoxin family protein [Empedobacter stercoris]MDM1523151.1 thioredoxin family protein [Empedobacter sp. 225-1]MDM1543121.1 thioredoxin family protein [Empedobacter sp. 189-2]NOJ75410.1 thioredoxin family protein [Empedobacter stercoris]
MKLNVLIIGFVIALSSIVNAQTATEILTKAQNQAKVENKNVFLIFHASWCGWCKKMEKNMDDPLVKSYFDANYVKTFITVQERAEKKNLETPGGDAVNKKLGGKDQGLPFWVILDSEGKVLEDSRVNGENIGGPASEDEVNNLIAKLETTSKNEKVNPEKIKEVFILKKK